MKVFTTQKELKLYLGDVRFPKNQIGFVPTMGALHKGHISLVEQSVKENDLTIASVFVNPTQFDKKEDLEKYPRTLESDLKLLDHAGCDIVFTPPVEDIYDKDITSQHFDFDGLELEMEGLFRTGHFNGVGTIVKSFFEIIQPTRAYFGEKDFQQLQIIRKMVEKNNLDIEILGCPIYREPNGLAMSSRNERLSEEQREQASIIYKILQKAKESLVKQSSHSVIWLVEEQFSNDPLFSVDYFIIADENSLKSVTDMVAGKKYRAFIAVYANSIRLIDNLSLDS